MFCALLKSYKRTVCNNNIVSTMNTGWKAKLCIRSYSRIYEYLCRFLVKDGQNFGFVGNFALSSVEKVELCLMNLAEKI